MAQWAESCSGARPEDHRAPSISPPHQRLAEERAGVVGVPPDTVWGWLIKALFQGLPVRGRIVLPQQGRRRPVPVKGRCEKLQSE